MTASVEIYVRLLDEAVDVWRPVRAERIREGTFQISPQAYDRQIETWEFEPGETVVCEQIEFADGVVLAATSRVADE